MNSNHKYDCCCDDCRSTYTEQINKPLEIKLEVLQAQYISNFAREWNCTPEQVIEGLIGLQIYCEAEYCGKDYIRSKRKDE